MKKTALAVAIVAIAAVSFLAGKTIGPGSATDASSRQEREILYYVDPMNPGFRSEEPGVAPCGMPLEPVYAQGGDDTEGAGPPLPPGVIQVSAARQQLIGVKAARADTGPMTHTLRLYGRVVPDENLTYRLNASTDSWVRELSDITTGGLVRRDEVLAQALAPSYYNAQVTFLIAMDNLDRIQRQLGGQLRHQQSDIADNQIRVAVQALQNLGITDAQVEELANTRKAMPYLQVRAPVDGVVLERNLTLHEWFKAGEPFYTIADIGRVWVYADVYEDEARLMSPGMTVKVVHAQLGRAFDAVVGRVLPLFDPVAKTLKVRIDVPNPDYELRPDMFVDVLIPITMPPALHVSSDAVIDAGRGAVVYVDLGNGVFEARQVTTGWRLGRRVQITSGLMPGEKVVEAGSFLIDSESRMRASASGSRSESARDPVCGMLVDVWEAESAGRAVTWEGVTWYFCMDQCRDAFEEDPERYVSGDGRHDGQGHPGSQGTGASWLAHLQGSARQVHYQGTGVPRRGENGHSVFGTSLTSRGVVDWDGPEPREGGWQKGWGRFPGAKYLGIEDEPEKPSE